MRTRRSARVTTEEIDAFSRLKILTRCPQGEKAATVYDESRSMHWLGALGVHTRERSSLRGVSCALLAPVDSDKELCEEAAKASTGECVCLENLCSRSGP